MNYYKNKLRTLLKGLLILILLVTSADAATLTVGSGQSYTTIQSAINAASPGDTIMVQSGTYYEHVDVNKTLTLQGVDTGTGLSVVDHADDIRLVIPQGLQCQEELAGYILQLQIHGKSHSIPHNLPDLCFG